MLTEFEFTYCPHCRSNFTRTDDHLVCTECKLKYYVNPLPTNAVILKNENNELLLVKRKHYPQKGLWDLPGGFININETVEESVYREISEELNIRISDIRYVCSFYDTYEFGGIKAYTICFLFEAKMINPKDLKASDDAECYEFFNEYGIPFDQFAFEPMRDALLRLYKRTTP